VAVTLAVARPPGAVGAVVSDAMILSGHAVGAHRHDRRLRDGHAGSVGAGERARHRDRPNVDHLAWDVATDDVGVTGYKAFKDDAFVADVTTGTSLAVSGLSCGTSYLLEVSPSTPPATSARAGR
jgi:hypothetical protein